MYRIKKFDAWHNLWLNDQKDLQNVVKIVAECMIAKVSLNVAQSVAKTRFLATSKMTILAPAKAKAENSAARAPGLMGK